jgi:carbamoyltransferase
MDGVGERDTSLLGDFDGPRLRRITGSVYPNSPGVFYSTVTSHLGFEPDSDEYKVMGLSSYGEPEFESLFRKMIHATPDGRIVVDTGLMDIHRGVHFARFAPAVEKLIGPPRRPGEEVTRRHENVAASAQRALETVGLELARLLRRVTDRDRLVISGGVGLNCVMNGLIEREAGFSEIYPLPAPHDAGTSIGAAVAAHLALFREVPLETPPDMYLGSSYSEKEIEAALVQSKQTFSRPADIHQETAMLVADGNVVGLYQGRMEFGPRALGNRSILADPRRADMKDIVNSVVKQREGFRPFAPSCLEERAGEYFDGCTRSRYMISTYMVRPGKAGSIPAVTHVDGTARVQTVHREGNPSYWRIIERFGELTGVPVVLNTSFNVKGEPIVEAPVDALRCFWGTGLDALSIPPFLIVKQKGQET